MSPRRTEPSWGDLRLGIIVVSVGLLALFGVIFIGSGRGPLRPETYTLYVHLEDAGGLRVGSPVEVLGAPAGQVVDVTILPPGTPGTAGAQGATERGDIRVELSVEERFGDHITNSSRAQLATLGMGGERYVKIVAGDVREPPVEPGAVIPTVASVDLDLVLAQAGRAGNEIQEIFYLGTQLQEKVASGAGTAGKLVDIDSPLYDRVYRFEDHAQDFLEALDHGEGVIAGWRSDGRFKANVEALRSDVAFLSDSSLALEDWSDPAELREAIRDLRGAAAALSAKLDSGQGTLGRLAHDQELFIQLRVLQLGLRDLIAALKEDPMGSVNIELF
ncbi:MAG TPA: MlaD family protein [Gemmatimonadota bacterium]|nr:MlaD family protein [Gemmatimonadota bacterium]